MFCSKEKEYFLWSKNDTRSLDYEVRYVVSDSPVKPIDASKSKVISFKSPETGHNLVLHIPNTDEWYTIGFRVQIPLS